jgi:exopolyphosphatase/guanosine-5'-triphosphate,3'-diphosphate pyrophosphatase
VDGYGLLRPSIARMLDLFASRPLAERREVPGLDPARAPTIVAGAAILLEALDAFRLDAVEVSRADILHGAALAGRDTQTG